MPDNPLAASLQAADNPPGAYDRAPDHIDFIEERDVYVAMRDGVRLCVDIYRPKSAAKVPALLAFAVYNKDMMSPDVAQALPLGAPAHFRHPPAQAHEQEAPVGEELGPLALAGVAGAPQGPEFRRSPPGRAGKFEVTDEEIAPSLS